MKALTLLLGMALFSSAALAQEEDCRPYYIQNGKDGPGSVMMVVLLPMMAVVASGVSAGKHIESDIDADAWCAPLAIVENAKDRFGK